MDTSFRLALAICLIAIVAIMLPFRIKSSASRESLDRRREGVFMLATLRPVAAALWLGTFAFVLNPAWMSWSAIPLPEWLRWSGFGVCALAVTLLLWTLPSLGTNLTDTVVTRERHSLVTRGPYRWVRHPFYDAMALEFLAASLLAANWFVLASGVVVFALLALRVRTEEAHLLARFGAPYRLYRERTGRFLPRMIRTGA